MGEMMDEMMDELMKELSKNKIGDSVNQSSLQLSTGHKQPKIAFSEVRDSYQRNSNWWTVFACFELLDCELSATGIANRTQLAVGEVEDALRGLCLLGHLQSKGDHYARVEGADFLNFNFASMSLEEVLDCHGLVSQQILNDLPGSQKVAFDHRCFAANDAILKELYKDLRAAFDKAFVQAQTQQHNDRIFKMTFTAVDVLSKTSKGKKS